MTWLDMLCIVVYYSLYYRHYYRFLPLSVVQVNSPSFNAGGFYLFSPPPSSPQGAGRSEQAAELPGGFKPLPMVIIH